MKKNKLYNPVLMMPAIVIYSIFFIVPVLMGFYYSMTNWNAFSSEIKFIGLDNFKVIFDMSGPYFDGVVNTLLFTFFTTIFKVGIGLAFALLLNKEIRSKNYLRALYFLPHMLSPLIIGIVFKSILASDGILNQFLGFLQLDFLVTSWLSNINVALYSTMAVEVWRMVGWNMVICLAGLQMINGAYYEAASIDGANAFHKFRYITLPLLIPTISSVSIINIIHGIRTFDLIYVLTGGGPARATEVINTNMFKEYSSGLYGLSTALSVVIFVFAAIITLFMKSMAARKEN